MVSFRAFVGKRVDVTFVRSQWTHEEQKATKNSMSEPLSSLWAFVSFVFFFSFLFLPIHSLPPSTPSRNHTTHFDYARNCHPPVWSLLQLRWGTLLEYTGQENCLGFHTHALFLALISVYMELNVVSIFYFCEYRKHTSTTSSQEMRKRPPQS